MVLILVVAVGLALASVILLQNILGVVVILAVIAFDLYWFYVRFYQKKKQELRYPLVPPEGKSDIYLPRTNIPRPIYEDARRMQEKKRRLAKLNKMRRKKK